MEIIELVYNGATSEISKKNESFLKICKNIIAKLPVDRYGIYYSQLQAGRAVLETIEQLDTYLACYGEMHIIKLNKALDLFFSTIDLCENFVEIIDWGSGQALASCVLTDYIRTGKTGINIASYTLIDQSEIAVMMGNKYISSLGQRITLPPINVINQKADEFLTLLEPSDAKKIKIHFFSNFLDICSLNLDQIYQNVARNFTGINYFVCVSPMGLLRMDKFGQSFSQTTIIKREKLVLNAEIFRPSSNAYHAHDIRMECLLFSTNI